MKCSFRLASCQRRILVSISINLLLINRFSGCFATELAKLAVILDMYEISCSRFEYYLRKSKEDWCKIAEELKTERVEMMMTTIHDDSFKDADYPFGVKLHLRCENKIDGDQMALEPVKVGRGFGI